MNLAAPVTRIGRRRFQTMYPGITFHAHPTSYTTTTLILTGEPLTFHVPNHLPFDHHGLPVIPGGIQYYAGDAILEADLGLDPAHGFSPGLGKFVFISGRYAIEGQSAHFRVESPDVATDLILLVPWSPDCAPPEAGIDCGFGCMSIAKVFSRREPTRNKAGVASYGLDFWVLSRCPATEVYFDFMAMRLEAHFGVRQDPRDAAECRRILEYITPAMRRLQVRATFEDELCKITRGLARKWFVPYVPEATQDVIDCLCAKALRNALGFKIPRAPSSQGTAIARVF